MPSGVAARQPGELFAAAALAFESGDERQIESVLQLAGKAPGLWRAAASALGWLPPDIARPHVSRLVEDTDEAGVAWASLPRPLGDAISAMRLRDGAGR